MTHALKWPLLGKAFVLGLAAATLLWLAACAPPPAATTPEPQAAVATAAATEPPPTAVSTATPVASATPAEAPPEAVAPESQPAVVVLPDGTTCYFVGLADTPSFDGQRVTYACELPDQDAIALLGAPVPGSGGAIKAERAVIAQEEEDFTLKESGEISATVSVVVTADGTPCSLAEATVIVDGQPMNYVCGTQGEDTIGLIGDFRVGEDGTWMATAVLAGQGDTGYVAKATQEMPVLPVQLELADGWQCVYSAAENAPSFDGKRADYTCQDPKADIVVLLGDFQPAGETTWTVAQGLLGRNDQDFSLKSSQEVSFLITEAELADGSKCQVAAEGDAITVGGQPVAYTCEAQGENTLALLVGPQPGEAGVWTAEQALVVKTDTGFDASDQTTVEIAKIVSGKPQ